MLFNFFHTVDESEHDHIRTTPLVDYPIFDEEDSTEDQPLNITPVYNGSPIPSTFASPPRHRTYRRRTEACGICAMVGDGTGACPYELSSEFGSPYEGSPVLAGAVYPTTVHTSTPIPGDGHHTSSTPIPSDGQPTSSPKIPCDGQPTSSTPTRSSAVRRYLDMDDVNNTLDRSVMSQLYAEVLAASSSQDGQRVQQTPPCSPISKASSNPGEPDCSTIPWVSNYPIIYSPIRFTSPPSSPTPSPLKGGDVLPYNIKIEAVCTITDEEYRNINREGVMFPEYVCPYTRWTTYESWPRNNNHISTVELSNYGFFYTAFSDLCRCFCCGVALRDWLPASNPRALHRAYSPTCMFIKMTDASGMP